MTEQHQSPHVAHDLSHRAADYLIVLGILNLAALNLIGLFDIWFAIRIREKRNGFRLAAMWLNGIAVVLNLIFLIQHMIDPMIGSLRIGQSSLPLIRWLDVVVLAVSAAIHALPIFWLGSRGTRRAFELAAKEGAVSTADIAPRSASTFFLLRLLHLPFLASIAIVFMSLRCPPSTSMPIPSHAGTQFGWFKERMRWESWNDPIEMLGSSYSGAGSYLNPNGVFATGSLGIVSFGRNSRMKVQTGDSYEFRPRQAVLWAFLLSVLVATTEFMWRRKKKRQPGHCASCGYDLRATLDRCPECGTVVPRISG